MRPSMLENTLAKRFDAIDVLQRSTSDTIVSQIKSALKSIKNIPKILCKMQRRVVVSDWQHLLKFCHSSLKIKSLLIELNAPTCEIFQNVLEAVDSAQLQQVSARISRTVDFDASASDTRTIVKEDVDQDLDELKVRYYGLNDLLV